MEKVKKILKERASGLFLLLFAGLIVAGLSSDFSYADYKKGQNQPEKEQISSEEQVRGDENENLAGNVQENVQEIEESGDISEESADEAGDTSEETVDETSAPDPEKSRCDDLKRLLKKYCGKNYNVKKCRSYLIETRDLSKKDDQCKSLYKKYHLKNSKNSEEKKDTNSSQIEESSKNELEFLVGSKKFNIAFEEGESVFNLMKRAKNEGKIDFKYDDFGGDLGIFITEIDGIKNESGVDWKNNKYWILYVSGKSSSLGCSNHKLNKADTSIEWKYEKY